MMHHFDPERGLELIEREQITIFGGVPAMVMQVLDSPSFATRDTSSVRSISYGGAPAPPDLVRRIKEHFPEGAPANGYGLTETSAMTTMNLGDDYVRKPDSVGPPAPVCEVAVVPDEYVGEEPPTRRRIPSGSASYGSRARTWCAATGTARPRQPPPSPADGSIPATWPGSTRKASSTSWTGRRT